MAQWAARAKDWGTRVLVREISIVINALFINNIELVTVVIRYHYPATFTPLRKPPRCPVSATKATATNSRASR
jgi:hypothetical protein